ncbi:imm11 family protein [Pyxidicoccus xibeiensis]|uniref:imm11 family protein n=1 Tax=Pyxidicoccus xibeiensis TaxID=2906759 RepID=UPI0020A72BBC|nr:DUF1629 domain-containing protein [Pyxidicoccus xibeiensis]MCP3143968.1 hypothetical protein [Pyxidicoccus xibeiensis]
MRYFVFVENGDVEDNAVLSDPPESIKDELFRFREGVPLKDWFPSPAVFPMDPEFPKARKLYDLQATTLSITIASKALKTTFDEAGCDNVEYLPILIHNHRGKLASADYCIANILQPVDAMDREASIYTNSALIPSLVTRLEKLVLRMEAIPPGLHLFRLTGVPHYPLVSETLKRAIEKKKLTGMLFVAPEEFNSALY